MNAGGVSLHIHCAGHGTPVVVFDSGLGNDGSVWKQVQGDVARTTEACVYDRSGLGYSGTGPKPRTSRQMVTELHALLASAELPPPYVLVGHSLGGLNVQLYASERLDEVAGMVLVDSMTENQDSRFWALLPPENLREFQDGLHTLPDGIDFDNLRESMAQVRTARRPLGRIPLVVLTHGKEEPTAPGESPDLAARMSQVWGEMQADLAPRSPNSVQVVARSSGHFIQFDAPKLLVGAVLEVVRAARTPSGLDAGPLRQLAAEGSSAP